nr:hypothetical protein [Maliibacterium massiliense]
MDSYIKKILQCVELTGKWLDARISDDGVLKDGDEDLGRYYKAIYPTRSMGKAYKASRMLDHVMDICLTPEGDLHNQNGRAAKKTNANYTTNFCQCYSISWITWAAFITNRFDVFNTLFDGMLRNYYDPEVGCYRSVKGVDIYDTNSAALLVETASMRGDYALADKGATFLARVLKAQPDSANSFYFRVNKDFSISYTPEDVKMQRVIEKRAEDLQVYWLLGMPAVALSRLYAKTRKEQYLRLAQDYYEQFLSCGDGAFCAPGSGKSMWAGTILYRLTGDEKYLKAAKRILDYFFSIYRTEGPFAGVWAAASMKDEDITPKYLYDVVPEYLRWHIDAAAELSML